MDRIKKISIEFIPHREQRYPTVGDWFFRDDELVIRVSDLHNWKYNAAIAVHELVEVLLCASDGVTQLSVDNFDTNFELNREEKNFDEPGDDPDAPYHKQHGIATGVERILIAQFGENWSRYEKRVNIM